MHTILTVTQVFLSIALIALVLIQHGRGADAGAAFGSGASATVFGARGSGSFLSRATGIIAALFFLTSMTMAYYASKGSKPAGLMDGANGMAVKVQTPAADTVQVPADKVAPVAVQPASKVSSSEVPVVPAAAVQSSGSDVPVAPGAPVPPAGPAGAVAPRAPTVVPDQPVKEQGSQVSAPAAPKAAPAPEQVPVAAPIVAPAQPPAAPAN